MGFSCSAVSGYFSSRPPVSIFIFSMLALSVSLLGLAAYCHYKSDLQAEVLDWSRLLREMSELRHCLGNSSQTETSLATVETASLGGVPVLGEVEERGGKDVGNAGFEGTRSCERSYVVRVRSVVLCGWRGWTV